MHNKALQNIMECYGGVTGHYGSVVHRDGTLQCERSITEQKMLDICYGTDLDLDVVFNAKKSALFVVGKAYEVAIDCLCIGYDSISWTTSLKYLGMFFTAGHKLECDIDYSVRKFYTAANTIYSHINTK